METSQALDAFGALGQPTRLAVFRLLIQAGKAGMAAGDVSEALGVRQNTMSANLSILARAGLIRSEREGRSIRYFADMAGLRGLLAFLLEDCCGGNPALCQPVIEDLACPCPPSPPSAAPTEPRASPSPCAAKPQTASVPNGR